MADNLGPDVSVSYDAEGYNYDTVVFQKQKPPLDSELNAIQQLEDILRRRNLSDLPSGWMTFKKLLTDSSLENSFWTGDPSEALPEFAVVNGWIVRVTNTNTEISNANLIELPDPPRTDNDVNGIFLEVWRSLLDPDTDANKPPSAVVTDSLQDIYMVSSDIGWIVGDSGLILKTSTSGSNWNTQFINTSKDLKGVTLHSDKIGWVVGDGGFIGRTSNGVDWLQLTSPSSESLNAIHSRSSLIAWIVGDSGTILKTTNGISWSLKTSGINSNLNSVYFPGDLVGFAVGDGGALLKTNDGGNSWTSKLSNTSQNLNSIYMFDLTFGFIVGDGGTILHTGDGGETWTSQSGNIFDGSYTSTTENLRSVFIEPSLDIAITDEEVSSQLDGVAKSFTVENKPITKGDGTGTTTNVPADVTVTVNGLVVAVDAVNGASGIITLAEAPQVCDTVFVSYNYRTATPVFSGTAWMVGTGGVVYRTDDVGSKWIPQTSGVVQDLNSIHFVDKDKGWLAGDLTVIRNTVNGGYDWNEQQSDVLSRDVQKVYLEGNLDTGVLLNDNSIHPDANVETTKRVQVQYRIRVISSVDPESFPEAGLGSPFVFSQGSNLSTSDAGNFPYENQQDINGDAGLWKAKCLNTVDGYSYAVPMFFVNRRNTSPYSVEGNANGSATDTVVRPDMLTATQVVATDILDVRRRVILPSAQEMLDTVFDQLSSSNTLTTQFAKSTAGGVQFGSKLLQVDRLGGGSGGTNIGGAVAGTTISSEVVEGVVLNQAILPQEVGDDIYKTYRTTGIPISADVLSPDISRYKAKYVDGVLDNANIVGSFSGVGGNEASFKTGSNAVVKIDEDTLGFYDVSAPSFTLGKTGLSKIPNDPQLVENFDDSGNKIYYHGVLEGQTKTVEEWPSGISGNTNNVLAYSSKSFSDAGQQLRASSLELHQFIQVTPGNSTQNTLTIPKEVIPDGGSNGYTVFTVRKLLNVTSTFSIKISNVDNRSSDLIITTEAGFEFIAGHTLELIASVVSGVVTTTPRNGASVNFIPNIKKVDLYTKSVLYRKEVNVLASPSLTITLGESEAGTGSSSDITEFDAFNINSLSSGSITGMSTSEIAEGIDNFIVWNESSSGLTYEIVPVSSVTGFGTDSITVNFYSEIDLGTVLVQLMVQESVSLKYQNAEDGLLLSYYSVPSQSQSILPEGITLKVLTQPEVMNISNLGTGGGVTGEPYSTPLQHIPVNDAVLTDDQLYNLEPLKFNNFKVDSGFVQMPVISPGSFSEEITLSNAKADSEGRWFYESCSKEFKFSSEGLLVGNNRKMYIPVLANVLEVSGDQFVKGDNVLVIFSRNDLLGTENITGFIDNSNSVVALYKLDNRPLTKLTTRD